jgi:hypothetical protein
VAFYPGSTYDRQSRRAVISNDHGQLDGPLPLRSTTGEVAPIGDSTLSTRLPPYGYRRLRDYTWDSSSQPYYLAGEVAPMGEQVFALPPAYSARPRSRDYTWEWNALVPNLIGQDEMAAGSQSAEMPPAYTTPKRLADYSWEANGPPLYLTGEVAPVGEQSYALPPIGRERESATLYDPGTNFLVGLTSAVVPPGAQSYELPPRAPSRLQDYTWESNGPPNYLTGEVAPLGAQSFELPPKGYRRSYSIYDPGSNQIPLLISEQAPFIPPPLATELPPRSAARSRDYTWTQRFELSVFGELPFGQSTPSDLPPRTTKRIQDYTWLQRFELSVYGELPFGQQTTDSLPPRAAPRSRDYTWKASSQPYYLAGEVAPMGVQSFELPPRGRQRGADLSTPYNDTIWLDLAAQEVIGPGKSTDKTELPARGPARSRDYSFEYQAQIPNLVGTDATVTGRSTFGTELPTRAPSRHRDYTWLQSFGLSTFQELPYGAQLTGNAPRGYQRAASLYDPLANNTLIPDFITAQAPPPGKGSRDTELPPRGYLRSRDYTFIHPADIQLFGQDAMVTGRSTLASDLPPRVPSRQRDYTWLQTYGLPTFEQLPAGAQLSGNAPRGYARASSLYEPGVNFLVELTSVGLPPGVQSTDLPPRGVLRSRDNTWLQSYQLPIFEQLPTGQQNTDNLPPRSTARSRDYTFEWDQDVPLLIGQDAVNPGKSTDATALPPRGPQRSKDYTWLQSMPLHVFQELPPGDSTLVTEGPPKGPQRLKDYTFLNVNVRYIGQDTMYGAPGEVPTYDWPNPIPYKRPINIRDFVNPQVLFTGKPVTPGTVLAGSSLTATVLAGSSALGSTLGGTSALGSVLAGTSQTEL